MVPSESKSQPTILWDLIQKSIGLSNTMSRFVVKFLFQYYVRGAYSMCISIIWSDRRNTMWSTSNYTSVFMIS